MIRRFAAPDGLSLAYTDEPGAGPPLLCLPGLTRNGSDFDDLAAALSGRHRLVRLDLRGRGRSDRDPEPMNYAPAVEARDALGLLDHLGIDRAVVVGTSRGGLVAMVMAAAAPGRLAGVLLNDIGPEIDPRGLARIMSYVGVAPRAASFEELAAGLEAMLGPTFPGVPRERWLASARRWFDEGEAGRPVLNYDPALALPFAASEGRAAPDMWPLFDALAGIPVAVVRGAHSDILAPATVEAMRARRPDLVVAEVPDRGHVPFLDEPEALAALDALLGRVG